MSMNDNFTGSPAIAREADMAMRQSQAEQKHSPEPWHFDNYGDVVAGREPVKVHGFRLSSGGLAKENTARIVACVNVCKGIPQVVLENTEPGRAFVWWDAYISLPRAAIEAPSFREWSDRTSDELRMLRKQHSELLKALRALTASVSDLASESEGVTGLHLNGNLADWDELLSEGGYLSAHAEATEILAKYKEQV